MGSARDALTGFAPSAQAGPITPRNSCAPATLVVCVTLVSDLLGGREGQGLVQPGSGRPRCCRGCDGNPTSWNEVTGSTASPAVPPPRGPLVTSSCRSPSASLQPVLHSRPGRGRGAPGASVCARLGLQVTGTVPGLAGRCRCAVGGLSLMMPPLPRPLAPAHY